MVRHLESEYYYLVSNLPRRLSPGHYGSHYRAEIMRITIMYPSESTNEMVANRE